MADAAKAAKEASLAAYGDEQIELLAEFYGKKGAIIDGNSRVFDGEAAIDQWRKFRTAELDGTSATWSGARCARSSCLMR